MRIERTIPIWRENFNKLFINITPKLYDYNLQLYVMRDDDEYEPYILSDINSRVGKLFDRIEIETINKCNGMCDFCPVNAGIDPRTHTYMSDELFQKIIDDLTSLNYSGMISLFSNNEPLLDPHILDRVEYAFSKLPLARHFLYTNGTLLTKESYKRLTDSLHILIIDNYAPKISERLLHILKDDKPNVIVKMRSRHEILSTRGGQAHNRLKIESLKSPCQLPFAQMIVRPTGLLSLCCNDALGVYTLGDLNKQSIYEAWNNPSYFEIRKKLLHGRSGIKLCDGCDNICKTLERI